MSYSNEQMNENQRILLNLRVGGGMSLVTRGQRGFILFCFVLLKSSLRFIWTTVTFRVGDVSRFLFLSMGEGMFSGCRFLVRDNPLRLEWGGQVCVCVCCCCCGIWLMLGFDFLFFFPGWTVLPVVYWVGTFGSGDLRFCGRMLGVLDIFFGEGTARSSWFLFGHHRLRSSQRSWWTYSGSNIGRNSVILDVSNALLSRW